LRTLSQGQELFAERSVQKESGKEIAIAGNGSVLACLKYLLSSRKGQFQWAALLVLLKKFLFLPLELPKYCFIFSGDFWDVREFSQRLFFQPLLATAGKFTTAFWKLNT
jgi:hypothetical protein